MTGNPVTSDQKLEAARQVAFQDLVAAEERVLRLAGWPGPFARGEWRDPLSGVFCTRAESSLEGSRP